MQEATQRLHDAIEHVKAKAAELRQLAHHDIEVVDDTVKAWVEEIKAKIAEITGHMPTLSQAAQTVAQSEPDSSASIK